MAYIIFTLPLSTSFLLHFGTVNCVVFLLRFSLYDNLITGII
jgi:hypothetical protein